MSRLLIASCRSVTARLQARPAGLASSLDKPIETRERRRSAKYSIGNTNESEGCAQP